MNINRDRQTDRLKPHRDVGRADRLSGPAHYAESTRDRTHTTHANHLANEKVNPDPGTQTY